MSKRRKGGRKKRGREGEGGIIKSVLETILDLKGQGRQLIHLHALLTKTKLVSIEYI